MTTATGQPPEGETRTEGRVIGRYLILDEIASGGMATVHLAHVEGQDDFVAVKCMHAHYARDPDFVSMFLDEAMLCTQIRHENVVRTIDVANEHDELLLVLELVEGESLSKLAKSFSTRRARIPQPIVSAVLCDMLRGLHGAHEATNESGEPLMIVHRDVSPHNVLVGTDGVARVLDFGVAKARGRVQQTQKGQLKGKLAYMSPEQARGKLVDRRSDIFAAGIVLWELLTGQRLFDGENEAALLVALLSEKPSAPSGKDPTLARLDGLVLKALETDPDARYATALEMVTAVEAAIPPATHSEVAAWVKSEARAAITRRHDMIRRAKSRVQSLRGPRGEQRVEIAVAAPNPALVSSVEAAIVAEEPPSAARFGVAPATKNPELGKPELAKPELAKPELAKPELGKPELAKPSASDPRPAAIPAFGPPAGLGAPTRKTPANGTRAPRPLGGPAIGVRPRPEIAPSPTLAMGAIDEDSTSRDTTESGLIEVVRTSGTLDSKSALGEAAHVAPPFTAPVGPLPKATPPPMRAPGVHTPPAGVAIDVPGADLWDVSTTSDDGVGTLALPPKLNPVSQLMGTGPAPARPQLDVRDATLPLYQPPAAFLQAQGFDVGEPHAPVSSDRGRLDAPTFGAPPSQRSEVRGYDGAPEHDAREGIPSQVTSVTLTTTEVPPPLHPEHVRRLTWIGAVSASVGALTAIALIVILTKRPWADPPQRPVEVKTTTTSSLSFPTAAPSTTGAPSVAQTLTVPTAEPSASGSAEPVVSSAPVAPSATTARPTPKPAPGPMPTAKSSAKPGSSSKPGASAKPGSSSKPGASAKPASSSKRR